MIDSLVIYCSLCQRHQDKDKMKKIMNIKMNFPCYT